MLRENIRPGSQAGHGFVPAGPAETQIKEHFMKKKTVRILTGSAVGLFAVGMIGGAVLSGRAASGSAAAPAAVYAEAQAERSSIRKTVVGTGTISDDDPVDVKVPTGIRIDKVLVEKGDEVEEGTPLATVDPTSVKTAISGIQQSISSIDESLSDLDEKGETKTVKAPVAGTVEKVCIGQGDDAAAVTRREGRLMTLVVDGQPVEITATSGEVAEIYVKEGQKVKKNAKLFKLKGVLDTAKKQQLLSQRKDLTDALGKMLELDEIGEIRSTAEGTVQKIHISDDTEVSGAGSFSAESTEDASSALSSIAGYYGMNAEVTGETPSLTAEPYRYGGAQAEEALRAVEVLGGFLLLSAEEESRPESAPLTAPSAEETAEPESAQTFSASEAPEAPYESGSSEPESAGTSPESTPSGGGSTPGGKDTPAPETEVKYISPDIILPVEAPAKGGKAAELQEVREALSTEEYSLETLLWLPEIGEDGTYEAGTAYTAVLLLNANAKEGYLFRGAEGAYTVTAPGSAACVCYPCTAVGEDYAQMMLYVKYQPTAAEDGSELPAIDEETVRKWLEAVMKVIGGTADGTDIGNLAGLGSLSGLGGSSFDLGGLGGGVSLGGFGDISSISGADLTSAMGQSGLTGSSSWSTAQVPAVTVARNENVKVEISVDELDINQVKLGQAAEITMDALPDQTFAGTVSSVNKAGSSSGMGVTRFAVTITLPKEEGMLAGMNATATITVGGADGILTIPAEALQEEGSRTFVYTLVDQTGQLAGETDVVCGLADEKAVEITSGLEEGTTVFYEEPEGSEIADNPFAAQAG